MIPILEGMNKAYNTVSAAIKTCVNLSYSLTPGYETL